MMDDQVFHFISKLIEKTKINEFEWKSFSSCDIRSEIIYDLEAGRGGFDYAVNSIREYRSYYLKSGDGYVFLFEVYHGDPDVTSPAMDTLGLMLKVNNTLPLELISNYDTMQEILGELRLVIEKNMESKYSFPDVIYSFMNQVIGD